MDSADNSDARPDGDGYCVTLAGSHSRRAVIVHEVPYRYETPWHRGSYKRTVNHHMRDRSKRVGQVQPRDDCLALSSLGVRQDEVVFVAPLVPQEALLREAELFVSDRLVGQSVGQKRGGEFGDGVPQSERAPVLQHASVSFFVYQHCVGGLPGHEDCLEPQTNVVERCEERSPVRLTEITVGYIVGPGAELFIRRNRRTSLAPRADPGPFVNSRGQGIRFSRSYAGAGQDLLAATTQLQSLEVLLDSTPGTDRQEHLSHCLAAVRPV